SLSLRAAGNRRTLTALPPLSTGRRDRFEASLEPPCRPPSGGRSSAADRPIAMSNARSQSTSEVGTHFQGVAALLAVLLPGLGHAYLGEMRRGACVAAGVLGLFFGGMLIGGIDVVDRQEDPIWFLGEALVGPLAFGVNWVHQNQFKVVDGPVRRTA